MKKKNIIIICLVVLLIIGGVFIILNVNKKEKKEETNEIYWVNEKGEKINSSEGIDSTKVVEEFSIEKSQIVRSNGISTLTAKVINNGEEKKDVKFEVTFLDENNNELAKTRVLVGNIKKDGYSYINAGISADVSNATNIIYDIIK